MRVLPSLYMRRVVTSSPSAVLSLLPDPARRRAYSIRTPLAARGRADGLWAHLERRRELDYLEQYLRQSDAEQGRETACTFPDAFAKWVDRTSGFTHGREWIEIPQGLARRARQAAAQLTMDDLVRSLPDTLMEAFLGNLPDSILGSTVSPAFLSMKFTKRLRRTWLAHFSDAASRINADGFQIGVEDLEYLAYTTNLRDSAKPGGYNFAYRVEDAERYGRDSRGRSWKYGQGIVLFTAPAVLVHHWGDNEPQAIFWGADARNIVEVQEDEYNEDRRFYVQAAWGGRTIFAASDLESIAYWLEANWTQYGRIVTGRKDP